MLKLVVGFLDCWIVGLLGLGFWGIKKLHGDVVLVGGWWLVFIY